MDSVVVSPNLQIFPVENFNCFSGVILPISRPQTPHQTTVTRGQLPVGDQFNLSTQQDRYIPAVQRFPLITAAIQPLLSPSKRLVYLTLHTRHVKGNDVKLRAGRSHSPTQVHDFSP